VERLERAIEMIQTTIEDDGGALIVKMKVRIRPMILRSRDNDPCLLQPKAVSETEEQDLAQLMAKAGQENAEVSGDEDDDDAV
jgi:translation initiation factor 2 subunit 1